MQSRSLITAHRRWWDIVQPTLDAAAVMASLAIVHWFSGRDMDDIAMAMGLVAIVVFMLLSQLTGLHRRPDAGNAGVGPTIQTVNVRWNPQVSPTSANTAQIGLKSAMP